MKSIVKDTLVLFAITLVSGFLLGGVYNVTKNAIAENEKKKQIKANQTVFSEATEFEESDVVNLKTILDGTAYRGECTVDKVLMAKKDGELLGYVIGVTSNEGYGGDISIVVGIKNDGTVNGISILTISETAGLGMNAAKPKFYDQFAGKKVEKFVYTKNGAKAENEIDAISSATITTSAVTDSVNCALEVFQVIQIKAGE